MTKLTFKQYFEATDIFGFEPKQATVTAGEDNLLSHALY